MSGKGTKQDGVIFELNGRPEFKQAFPLALQHVVAMIVGCVTPAIIIGGIAGVDAKDSVILIQSALVIAAIATLLQVFSIGKKMGSGLPVIMGVSFAYLPSLQAIAAGYDLDTIFGAQIIGGLCAVIVGIFMKKLRVYFPPLITGTVVFTIGLSLYPTAVNYMAGGVGSENYGSWKNWLVAFITLAVVITLNHFGKGIFKTASILFGIVVGYVVALFFGMGDFSSVASAKLFQLPSPLHFGIKFEVSSIIIMSVLFIINSIQAMGEFCATTAGGFDRDATDEELQGGVIANGISNIIGALIGGLPTSTYGQNVGIVSVTKVVNKWVFGLAALIILFAGLIPKFSAVLTTIPLCVLGGATISVFATIAMTGLKLIVSQSLTYRNTAIVGLAVALGMGITQASNSLSAFPEWVNTIFGRSPVVVATIVAIFLNIVLPNKDAKK